MWLISVICVVAPPPLLTLPLAHTCIYPGIIVFFRPSLLMATMLQADWFWLMFSPHTHACAQLHSNSHAGAAVPTCAYILFHEPLLQILIITAQCRLILKSFASLRHCHCTLTTNCSIHDAPFGSSLHPTRTLVHAGAAVPTPVRQKGQDSTASSSVDEWALRCDLAVAYRIAYLLGWHQELFNHITVKIPGSEKLPKGPHFLINPVCCS